MRRIVMVLVLLALVSIGTIQVGPAPAHAEVSAACWQHLAGKKTAVTPAADRRYHLERGEPSPCTEVDANEGSRPAATPTEDKPKPDEGKSRYCRKKWFC
ncbi:site-specific recombination directionality factor RDF [Mycobacterium phage Loser]|uniref:site-specific recombination directionality factor RDF n=1 Tax=Mycobacterium phage Loser TaxID=1815969 RepID=UPI00078C8384|nr:site-specific recombination directionality factor RDF [Mycobacterium phage Loser]AMS00982.1 hypothetical protein SEA_LOSER_86 [Mycobacterium phage Loser]